MSSIIDQIVNIGKVSEVNPYVPFLPALEEGILVDPSHLARPIENPIGVDAKNGLITNAKHAGVVALGSEIAAIDHVSIEKTGSKLIISPSSKDAVDSDGKFNQEGGIILTTPEGWLKFIVLAIDVSENPWRFDRIRRIRAIAKLGNLVMMPPDWETQQEYEVIDTLPSHKLIVEQRKFHF